MVFIFYGFLNLQASVDPNSQKDMQRAMIDLAARKREARRSRGISFASEVGSSLGDHQLIQTRKDAALKKMEQLIGLLDRISIVKEDARYVLKPSFFLIEQFCLSMALDKILQRQKELETYLVNICSIFSDYVSKNNFLSGWLFSIEDKLKKAKMAVQVDLEDGVLDLSETQEKLKGMYWNVIIPEHYDDCLIYKDISDGLLRISQDAEYCPQKSDIVSWVRTVNKLIEDRLRIFNDVQEKRYECQKAIDRFLILIEKQKYFERKLNKLERNKGAWLGLQREVATHVSKYEKELLLSQNQRFIAMKNLLIAFIEDDTRSVGSKSSRESTCVLSEAGEETPPCFSKIDSWAVDTPDLGMSDLKMSPSPSKKARTEGLSSTPKGKK